MWEGCYTGSCEKTGDLLDAEWVEDCHAFGTFDGAAGENCRTVCEYECTPGECGGVSCDDNDPGEHECDGIGCPDEPVECGYWNTSVECDDCGCQVTYTSLDKRNCCTNSLDPDKPDDYYEENGNCPPCDEAL